MVASTSENQTITTPTSVSKTKVVKPGVAKKKTAPKNAKPYTHKIPTGPVKRPSDGEIKNVDFKKFKMSSPVFTKEPEKYV